MAYGAACGGRGSERDAATWRRARLRGGGPETRAQDAGAGAARGAARQGAKAAGAARRARHAARRYGCPAGPRGQGTRGAHGRPPGLEIGPEADHAAGRGQPWGAPTHRPVRRRTPPSPKILAQTSRIAARALASRRRIRTIVRMDENPGTPPARVSAGDDPGGSPRAAGRRARRTRRAGGRPCRDRRAQGIARGQGGQRAQLAQLPPLDRRLALEHRPGYPRSGKPVGAPGSQRRPWRAHGLSSLMTVRRACGPLFVQTARGSDPGPDSQPRTSGPSRGCHGRFRRRRDEPSRRPGGDRGANGWRSGRLVHMAGCAQSRQKMLLNLRLSFFGRKNLAQPRLARMLAWNPTNHSGHGRWYERDGATEHQRASCWRDEIPSVPPRPSSARVTRGQIWR